MKLHNVLSSFGLALGCAPCASQGFFHFEQQEKDSRKRIINPPGLISACVAPTKRHVLLVIRATIESLMRLPRRTYRLAFLSCFPSASDPGYLIGAKRLPCGASRLVADATSAPADG